MPMEPAKGNFPATLLQGVATHQTQNFGWRHFGWRLKKQTLISPSVSCLTLPK
jgi:hypothetical protein